MCIQTQSEKTIWQGEYNIDAIRSTRHVNDTSGFWTLEDAANIDIVVRLIFCQRWELGGSCRLQHNIDNWQLLAYQMLSWSCISKLPAQDLCLITVQVAVESLTQLGGCRHDVYICYRLILPSILLVDQLKKNGCTQIMTRTLSMAPLEAIWYSFGVFEFSVRNCSTPWSTRSHFTRLSKNSKLERSYHLYPAL